MKTKHCEVCGELFWLYKKGLKTCGRDCGYILIGNNSSNYKKKHRKEYYAWQGMKARCYNLNDAGYCNYGGRGITVCDRWINSFENFLLDMGLAPSKKHSIDRRDVHGNYTPNNCRWATRHEQSVNKRTNRLLAFNGVTMTLSEWASKKNISYTTLVRRVNVGWPIHRLFSRPRKQCNNHY
jgi:hypothetical protein